MIFLLSIVRYTLSVAIIVAPHNGFAEGEIALKSPCSLNFSLLIKGKGSPLDGVVFDKPPSQAIDQLNATHATSNVIISQIPTSEESFKSVFSKPFLTISDRSEIAAADIASNKMLIRASPVKNFDDFKAYIEHSNTKNVVLAGHNHEGKFFFIDGSSAYIWNISEACAEKQKTCIFVSCKSNRHVQAGAIGLEHDLTLKEGLEVSSKIALWLSSKTTGVSDRQLADYVASIETGSFLRYHVSYVALKGCGAVAGGTVVYILIQEQRTT